MYPVGKPLPRPTTRSDVINLFQFLWQLHEKDLIHGDPRVPNVILNGGQPLWIDLPGSGNGEREPHFAKVGCCNSHTVHSWKKIPFELFLDLF
jgi:hypothetical protein